MTALRGRERERERERGSHSLNLALSQVSSLRLLYSSVPPSLGGGREGARDEREIERMETGSVFLPVRPKTKRRTEGTRAGWLAGRHVPWSSRPSCLRGCARGPCWLLPFFSSSSSVPPSVRPSVPPSRRRPFRNLARSQVPLVVLLPPPPLTNSFLLHLSSPLPSCPDMQCKTGFKTHLHLSAVGLRADTTGHSPPWFRDSLSGKGVTFLGGVYASLFLSYCLESSAIRGRGVGFLGG